MVFEWVWVFTPARIEITVIGVIKFVVLKRLS